MTNTPPPPRLAIRRPEDLLAAVPYLLGFHPTDSAVAIGVCGGHLAFAARADLPPEGDGPDELAANLAAVVARQRLQAAVLIGYGTAARVEPTLLALRAALPTRVYDVLRVTDGRYWSYCCTDPGCCDPAGTPFDVSSSAVAATAAYAGAVALPDRDALVARVAAVTGRARESMREATARAERRLGELVSSPGTARGRTVLLAEGSAAVRRALARHRAGAALTDDEVAWLTVLLRQVPVRDRIWAGITGPAPHVDLWADVVRRAEAHLAPAPASLLAFAAWRSGDGALAAVALDRALDADPSYSMALLIEDALRAGIPPSVMDDWPGPARPSVSRRRRRRVRTGGIGA